MNILMMEIGILPHRWKTSYITPIPKKGSLTEVENYRGIAMQSVIPKNFDTILTSKIYDHIHEIIPKTQHGFVKRRSTASNLLQFNGISTR